MARVVLLGGLHLSLVKFRGQLIQDLVADGHEVIGCAAGFDQGIADQLESWGARYVSVQLQRTGMNPLADIGSLLALTNTFRELKPDAVFAYTIKPVIYGTFAAKRADVAKVHSMITGLGYAFMGQSQKQKMLGYFAKALYRAALTKNDGVFFQNQDDANLFVELGIVAADKVTLTGGSGVDLDYFKLEPLPQGKTRFLMCGRILVEKGVREFFKAAAEVKRDFPDAEFVYVGPFDEGNPAGIQPEEIEALNADGQVEVHGFTDDVRPLFRDCSVYVLPSYREGTPRTVLEAASMGRPVITTNGPGGCAQTVREGETGYLVPVQNTKALVEAMRKFLRNPDSIEKMGRAGREYMAERFDVKVVNRTILDTMNLAR
ncbi:MAG: glycosyltransferase family 4 protein [Rhizobiaceae bacterium]